ncbi:MAG: preprotein translocase subunit SecE [Clostridia bacterium]|jgi:preprotein translocase subunit SecE|nr:preprotein translocase subunit SecE [Clostridia bacterium]
MGKAEKSEKTNKKQKHFWKDFKAELKKVIWPTRSQVANNTIIVIVIVLLVTAIVFVLDLAFEALNTYGIDKLKTYVQDSVVSDEEENKTNPEANNEEETNNEEGEEQAESTPEQTPENTEPTPETTPDDVTSVDNNL